MAPARRALIAVTSAHAPLYPDGKETGLSQAFVLVSATDRSAGLFVTEALHPFNVFKEAGFEVDLASETGSFQADWLSQQKDWLSGDDLKTWEDPQSEFRKRLGAHLKPSDIDPSKVK
jgi:D-lactate dehydratase